MWESIQEVRDSKSSEKQLKIRFIQIPFTNLSVFCRIEGRSSIKKRTTAPERRGSANTNEGESSNLGVRQVDQLAKMIQGYEEKNKATAEMMMEMRRMFDEKFQALEKENNALKQKDGRSRQSKTERNSISQTRKIREESEVKIVDSSTKGP